MRTAIVANYRILLMILIVLVSLLFGSGATPTIFASQHPELGWDAAAKSSKHIIPAVARDVMKHARPWLDTIVEENAN